MSFGLQENSQFINHRRLLIPTLVSLAGYVYFTWYEQCNFFKKKIAFQSPNKNMLFRIPCMFDKKYVW